MDNEIIIEVATDAKVFADDTNIIQYKGWNKVQEDLKRKLIKAEEYKPKNFTRVHETITVIGERGTGKSTFILNLYDRLKDEKLADINKIQPLKILDPTLISTRQNILVNIITLIKNEVKESDNFGTDSDAWEQSLKDLAEGINQIENIGSDPYKNSIWDDSVLILDKGLVESNAGLNFEEYFHKYIYESLKVLDKDMFLLILDDIDTNFKKGWDVLEILRKYITSPQLTTIVSGDINLYSLLIRQKQWELFEVLKKHERKNAKEYEKEIDHLVEQYLIKVLHPENYINLYRLDYFLFYNQNDGLSIKIKNNNEDPVDAKSLFVNIVENAFRVKRNTKAYIQLFAKLPIRSNMQILRAYFDAITSNVFNRKYFIQRVKDIFLSTFFKFKFDAQFIAQIRESHSIDALLDKVVIDRKLLKNIALKQIDSVDDDYNILITIIDGIYDTYFEDDLSKYIEWFIKIGITHSIVFDDILARGSVSERECIKFLQFDRYLSSDLRVLKLQGLVGNESGLFATSYRRKATNHKVYFRDEFNKPTEHLIEKISEYTEIELLALLLLGSVKTSKSSREDAFSPLYLIAFIEDICKFDFSELEEFQEFIEGYFSKLLQEDYRLTPSFKLRSDKDNEGNEDIEDDEDDISLDKINISEKFIESLFEWVQSKKTLDFPISEFSLAGQEFAKKMHSSIKPHNEFYSISEYINSSIYIFLNQVLYQNYRYEFGFDSIAFKEIRKSDSAFENFKSNMEKITDLESLKFFVYLNSCPLWDYYLSNKNFTGLTYHELDKYLIHSGKMSPDRFRELYQSPTLSISEETDIEKIKKAIEDYSKNKQIRWPDKKVIKNILEQENES